MEKVNKYEETTVQYEKKSNQSLSIFNQHIKLSILNQERKFYGSSKVDFITYG